MNWLEILEKYGIPVCVAVAFGFFIWKQNRFIQDELQKELRESFARVEGIIIKLIDQQKKMQLEQKGMERSYKVLAEIIARLSGNGLKDKFLRMPAWLIKIVANFIIKAISKRFNLSKINEYVEEDNELDIKVKAIKRDTMKYGRYIEELEKDVAILKSNSHPPIFGKKDKNDIIKRLKKLEKEQ